MSEEILKALMQLFAIILKQDEGVEAKEVDYVQKFLSQQLSADDVETYMGLFNKISADEEERKRKNLEKAIRKQKRAAAKRKEKGIEEDPDNEAKAAKALANEVNVLDSVRVMGICVKINKTLTQKQKIVVLVRLFELMNSDKKFTAQRMEIVSVVADKFNISSEEYLSVETFVKSDDEKGLENPHILVINGNDKECNSCKRIVSEPLNGNILILQIKSSELYFLRYTGKQDVYLNGLGVNYSRIYLFAPGSTIKLPKGRPIYYSDVVSNFLQDTNQVRLTFNVDDVSFRFPNGALGLRNISFSENQGKLVGIMGASGAGKTTLLNLLSGNNSPSEGQVLINGIDMHRDKEKAEGIIGYIPQDDLLIEELTVYENLYFNAKLCFKDKSEEEIKELVDKTLKSLGLYERKDLQVGNPLNKKISGGQRKRLNIALELIREPSILFVDEPTSGLSSRDSENVMDLLAELALKGKLIFVVIHQPSSDIYKMFDRMIILDTGGFLVYYGNPVEAIVHFKKLDNQINYDVGECPTCGNVTPELIFNIMEARVVDEFGQYQTNRKVSPERWAKLYQENIKEDRYEDASDDPPRNLKIPSWLQQFRIYTIRDLLSKVSNTQYILLNLLEAPLLGFILAFIIRYKTDPQLGEYIFRHNENIPPYIFMSIIVALFLGLTVSAEEIFRDRKILKREQFLNLSRSSYLVSKVIILTIISAIQAFLFLIVGNSILEIQGMYFEYWMVLFSTFVLANMIGLNVSSAFNSAVTIYILIPFILIPMMALGGAMFSFDKLNNVFGTIGRVPLIAEFMPSRWSYEALMVHQFTNNDYEKNFYKVDQVTEISSYKITYYIPELILVVDDLDALFDADEKTDSVKAEMNKRFKLLNSELSREHKFTPKFKHTFADQLTVEKYNYDTSDEIREYLKKIQSFYSNQRNIATGQRDVIVEQMEKNSPQSEIRLKKKHHNEYLADIIRKTVEKNNIVRFETHIVRQYRPIFFDPEPRNFLDFRTHFYAPHKFMFGRLWSTFSFNVSVLWLMTLMLYIALYYDLLKKALDKMGNITPPKWLTEFQFKKAFKRK
jgi:ABC-type multidrug transport system ATPase subunit